MQEAEKVLSEYGYSLYISEVINPRGHGTGVVLNVKRGRAQFRHSERGDLYWSGPPAKVGDFLERFWFAEKVTA